MKLIWLPVLTGAALLAGCAGGKSTFECGATAEDQCVTMLQANEKAALKTQSKRAGGAQQLPVVAEPSAKNTLTAPVGTTGKTAGVMVPPAVKATSVAAAPSHAGSATASAGYTTPVRPVDKPLRLAEGTGKIWVAAWVDRDGAYHADNVISVVTRPGEWR